MNFYGRTLPEPGRVAGYGWLIRAFGLQVPLPGRLAMVSERHGRGRTAGWEVFRSEQWPGDRVLDHLLFAIKNEGVDLRVLDCVVLAANRTEIEDGLRGTTGIYARKLWFLWEWLTGEQLDIPDLGKVKYVPLLDAQDYYAIECGEKSSRHKIIDNLPGMRRFCPLIARSERLDRILSMDLANRARDEVALAPQHIVRRAAAFLLLDDSKASFEIEQEAPGPQRAARWARAIAEAGQNPITIQELERLQQIVLQDARFVKMGLRREGGFIGRHDPRTQMPEPVHISARHEDLPDLLSGLADFETRALDGGMDPILVAAALAFGFVFIHPFEDGNGRLHRYLFHHVLARGGFNPPGIIFPVSAAILRRIDGYEAALTDVSRPMLEFIEWHPTPKGNVEVTSETAFLYRFFDATPHAEFLGDCVKDTIEVDLPHEISYLEKFDAFKARVDAILDMPSETLELLRGFLEQGQGKLSKRARGKEFKTLTDQEVSAIESAYGSAWPSRER